jgi:CHASE3 domain sensor protein
MSALEEWPPPQRPQDQRSRAMNTEARKSASGPSSASRLTTGQKIVIGVGLAILLQLFNGLYAYHVAQEYFATAALRRESFRILNTGGAFLSQLKDAETGQRGYLLTGEQGYLVPYETTKRPSRS